MVYKLHEEVIIRWHGFQPSRNNKVIANIIFLILNKHTPLYIVCPQTQTMGIAFGPRCPLYLFFQKRMPLPSLMRPCLQSVSLLFNKFQAAQQAPARRLAHAPAKSVRTAARYQPILRAHRRAGPCFFSLMSRWFYCPVKQPFQTISVF